MKPIIKNSKVLRVTTLNKEYNMYQFKGTEYDDEGIVFYPRQINRWAKRKRKGLMRYQMRMYKTWKHNRKTQWKY